LIANSSTKAQGRLATLLADFYGAPFVKILHLTDLAQKLLSLRIFSYLCAEKLGYCKAWNP